MQRAIDAVWAEFIASANTNSAPAVNVSVKTSPGAAGITVMPSFDWTWDKQIYQRWMNWSKWAKHALKAMEGDSEESKVSYHHHWLNIEGMHKMEHWKTQGFLIKYSDWLELSEDDKKKKFPDNLTESYFTMVESVLAPKSNPLLAIEELHHLKQNSMTSSEFHALITKTVKRCKFPNIKAEEKAIRDTLYLGMNSQHVRDKCITLLNNGKNLQQNF